MYDVCCASYEQHRLKWKTKLLQLIVAKIANHKVHLWKSVFINGTLIFLFFRISCKYVKVTHLRIYFIRHMLCATDKNKQKKILFYIISHFYFSVFCVKWNNIQDSKVKLIALAKHKRECVLHIFVVRISYLWIAIGMSCLITTNSTKHIYSMLELAIVDFWLSYRLQIDLWVGPPQMKIV